MKTRHWVGISVVAVMVLVAAIGVLAGNDNNKVEQSLAAYLHTDRTGLEVKGGSCRNMNFDRDGLHLWECTVVVPSTSVSGRVERRYNVAVNNDGDVGDASPK